MITSKGVAIMMQITTRSVVQMTLSGLAAALLSSCGNLSVTMEVLNPEVVQRQEDKALVASGLPKVLGTTDEGIDAAVREIKAAHRRGYERIRSLYLADAAQLSPKAQAGLKEIADSQVSGFESRLGAKYQALAADLARYQSDLKRLLGTRYTVTPADPDYRSVVDILRAWEQRVSQFLDLVRKDVGRFVATSPSPNSPLMLEQVQVLNRELASIKNELAQVSIQTSPYAFAVASAGRGDWSAGYNQVFSRGNLGATDIAIKLDPLTGNYLLKGLSFDPSDVAAVAAKVSTQALLLSAQIAGAPVKLSSSPTTGSTGAAIATSSGALADTQALLETQRAQDQARKAALLAIANAIVNEEADLRGNDQQRTAAMAAIRTAFEKRESILRPAKTQ